jgi:hypothetical protein
MERVTGWLESIPGYTGYRDKERRRDSDRRLRESIADQLSTIARRGERAGARLVSERKLDRATDVDALVQQIDFAANRVRALSYGYGGLFSDQPVGDRALDQLYLFDRGIATKVDQLDQDLSAIETELRDDAAAKSILSDASGMTQSLLDQIDTRTSVVDTAEPVEPKSIFGEPDAGRDEAVAPPPVILSIGDALSIMRDDFIVDATISIEDGPLRGDLYRLSQDPAEWLLVSNASGGAIARLEEKPESTDAGSSSRQTPAWTLTGPARLHIAGNKPTAADASLAVFESGGGDSGLAVRLTSGRNERYFTGSRVHPDDVAVYGQPRAR